MTRAALALGLMLVMVLAGAACQPAGMPRVGRGAPKATFTAMADGSSLEFPGGIPGRAAMVCFWQPG